MSDTENPDTGTGATNAETVDGQTVDTAKPSGAEEGSPEATNADFARARRKATALETEKAALQKKLDTLESANKTAAERAVEEAYAKGKSESDTMHTAAAAVMTLNHAIESAVVSAGMPIEFASIVKADGDVTEVADVEAAVTKLQANEWAKGPTTPGQKTPGVKAPMSNDPFPRGGKWDSAQVAEVRGRGEWSKYREQIIAAQSRGEI